MVSKEAKSETVPEHIVVSSVAGTEGRIVAAEEWWLEEAVWL